MEKTIRNLGCSIFPEGGARALCIVYIYIYTYFERIGICICVSLLEVNVSQNARTLGGSGVYREQLHKEILMVAVRDVLRMVLRQVRYEAVASCMCICVGFIATIGDHGHMQTTSVTCT